MSDHEHTWTLTESGYIRRWSTEIRDDGTIIATFGGTEDWSDDGDGNYYLECSYCLARKDMPDNYEIQWD